MQYPIFSPEYYMQQALRQAKLAYDAGEVPIGAIVVVQDKIVSRGYNQTEILQDPTAHAEMLALSSAYQELGSKYLPQATLYVTVEPCLMCCGAMYWSQLGGIVYGAIDVKNGYRQHLGLVNEQAPFHKKTQLQHGILADDCQSLMQHFFRDLR